MIGFRRLFLEGIRNPRGFIQVIAHLPDFVRLYGRLFKDPRVPLYLKIVLVLAFIYLVSPVDLLPDFLVPLLGQIDDLFILLIALRFFLKKCPRDVLMEHVRQIEAEG
ncbi:MAG: YkvA family protein [bacterium]